MQRHRICMTSFVTSNMQTSIMYCYNKKKIPLYVLNMTRISSHQNLGTLVFRNKVPAKLIYLPRQRQIRNLPSALGDKSL